MSRTAVARGKHSIGKLVALAVMVGAALLFAITYFWFVAPAVAGIDDLQPVDAVVVFVGDPERLDVAVSLMERGVAENLVIPNGSSGETRTRLCDSAVFQVHCPDTETIDTRGEAQAIGRLAQEMGWSSLIAVTSSYHVHRATYQLNTCHDGPITAVASETDLGRRELLRKIAHEWVGTLAAMTVQRGC